MPLSRPRVPLTLALVLLLAAAFLLWLPGVNGPYLLDDLHQIVLNPALRQEARGLLEASLSSAAGPLRRPVSMFSFALNLRLAGDADPASFKLVNIVLHLATGLGIYVLARQLLARLAPAPMLADGGARRREWTALLIAALWLLHPLHVSTVLYVVQRMTILAALFSVWAIVAYVAGRERLQRGQRLGMVWVVLALVPGGVLATLSKENGALLPLLLLALELTVFRFAVHYTLAPRYARALKGLLVLPVAALLAALGWYTATGGLHAYEVARSFTPGERLLTESRALWYYLWLLLWPDPRRMAIFHDDFALSTSLLAPPVTILAVLGLIALLAAALALRRRAPVFALAVLWFLVGHLLESTIVPLEPVFEHRNYLPSFGPLFALGYAVARLPQVAAVRPFLAAALAAALLALWTDGLLPRVHQWSDYHRLWLTELRQRPDSARTNYVIGGIIADNGHHAIALDYLGRAAALDPRETAYALAVLGTGFQAGDSPEAALLDTIGQRLRTNPLTAMTQLQLGGVLTARAESGDPRFDAPTDRVLGTYVETVLAKLPSFTRGEADSVLGQLARLLLQRAVEGTAVMTPESLNRIALGQALYHRAGGRPESAREWMARIEPARLGAPERRLLAFVQGPAAGNKKGAGKAGATGAAENR